MLRRATCAILAVSLVASLASGADLGLKKGDVTLKTASAITFGPDGVLFVGDATQASVFAIDTGDAKKKGAKTTINIKGIGAKIAGLLGVNESEVLIADMAVNPISGNVYFSVARGRGPDAQSLIIRCNDSGDVEEFATEGINYARAEIPNPPAAGGTGRRNLRSQSITDIGYQGGRVFIAGLSNEEFASTLRSLPFPFKDVDTGTSVEIFHGAHGKFETRSPVRTFTFYEIASQPHILAAYTCTPLVKFPVKSLSPGEKIRGTTVAELGNRNRPLDMVAYQQGDENFILLSNSARGVMKISTGDLDRKEGIEERISGTAGQSYQTIKDLEGVVQLDQFDAKRAVVLITNDQGTHLRTIDLP
jgi:hypothetical protein